MDHYENNSAQVYEHCSVGYVRQYMFVKFPVHFFALFSQNIPCR